MIQIKRFGLLIFAYAIAVFAFVNLYLDIDGSISVDFIVKVVVIFIFLIIVQIILAKVLPNSDKLIFPLIVLLNGIGLAQINRIDYSEASIYGDGYSFAVSSQLIFSLIGVVVVVGLCLVLKEDRVLRSLTWTSMFIGIVLLLLPLIPGLGVETYGASVWISLGPLGTMQPAEFAKIFLTIFFAGYLTINRERLQVAGRRILGMQFPRLQDLGPILVVWFVSLAVLIFQHDLGTSLLFFGLFIALLYTATGKASWAIIGLILFSAGSYLVMNIFPHVAARIQVWTDPFNPDIYNRAYNGSGQVVQGFFALSSGGLFGKGIGEGFPALTPFSNSDFIYSSLGEEFGLTGLLAILVIYLLLIERAISISLNIDDKFGKLLACGIGFSLSLQIFVVVGGVTGIIPITGLTLPFIAKGGSSVIANYLMLGILLLVSNRVKQVKNPRKSREVINKSPQKGKPQEKKVING
jgi:cell division protein FtsW (lipid II flippase)